MVRLLWFSVGGELYDPPGATPYQRLEASLHSSGSSFLARISDDTAVLGTRSDAATPRWHVCAELYDGSFLYLCDTNDPDAAFSDAEDPRQHLTPRQAAQGLRVLAEGHRAKHGFTWLHDEDDWQGYD